MIEPLPACPLCQGAGGDIIVRSADWRLIRAREPGFPAFYRVVWNAHVREFSDLAPPDRHACLDVVTTVEEALRRHLAPDKVNLATLGNAVAHLHWHVIARFAWDSHFPGAVWASAQREAPADRLAAICDLLPTVEAELVGKLGHPPENRRAS